LAENPALARACADNGLVFVGPPPGAIAAMGDKIAAKRTVAAAGVPVVPGSDDPSLTDAQLAEAALAIGLAEGHPVLLKPSAGGGESGARTRAAMGASAVAAAQAVGYTGAGTVEYIVSADRPDEYFFMEMNTRLQVEHPVTELAVTAGPAGPLDLVELQLRVA